MQIKGLQKLTLLDYPEKMACTVFLGGCNFRCPFCHNASLVLPDRFGESIDVEDFFSFLDSRKGKLQGVCISGGEPTLNANLPDFIKRIKDMGFLVKLDTNGTAPDMLNVLIEDGLIDYVAMDIKSSPEGYSRAVGLRELDISKIYRSAEILMQKKVDFEFRTTVVRELHTADDIVKIGNWLKGDEKYFLQGFIDSGDVIQNGFSAYSVAEMNELKKLLCEFIPLAQIRN